MTILKEKIIRYETDGRIVKGFDAGELIRCRDCVKWDRKDGTLKDVDDKEWHNCKTLCFLTMAYFYCADAEREAE